MTVKCMALEEAPKGVRINGVMPGGVLTDMLKQFTTMDE